MPTLRLPVRVLLLASLVFAPALAAQDLRVSGEGVRLRAGASKFTHIVRVLADGEELALVRPDSLRNEFFHVRAAQGEGWVHGGLVERAQPPALVGEAVAPVVLDADHPAANVSVGWEKPPLLRTTFREGEF